MPWPEDENWITPFIASLERLVSANRDNATLAKLRRGLSDHAAERDIWVYQHLHGASPRQEEPAALVGSLFALWHQGGRGYESNPPRSLGGSFKALADTERRHAGLKPGDSIPNVERRFAVLLDSHPDDLPVRLRHAVSLLRSKDVPIDWSQLLRDRLAWKRENRPVQRRWARDFWTGRASDQSADADGKIAATTATTLPATKETIDDR